MRFHWLQQGAKTHVSDQIIPFPEVVMDLVQAQRQLVRHYDWTALRFTLDGRLIGDLGEAIALENFVLEPCKAHERRRCADTRHRPHGPDQGFSNGARADLLGREGRRGLAPVLQSRLRQGVRDGHLQRPGGAGAAAAGNWPVGSFAPAHSRRCLEAERGRRGRRQGIEEGRRTAACALKFLRFVSYEAKVL